MSPVTCPNGHPTSQTDYCDTCGAPVSTGGAAAGPDAASSAPVPAGGQATSASPSCPNCQTVNLPDALFCEACGYDFTTGAMPRTAPPATPAPSVLDLGAPGSVSGSPGGADLPAVAPGTPVEWVVEVWVDPDWYAEQDTDDPLPSPGLPAVVPLRAKSLLVGRTSTSRNIHPDVDCGTDSGVSRRQAQLSTDGSRWWIEDLQSSNGTYVGPGSGPLPTQAITPGQRKELAADDRVYVGAWTRLVVRAATDDEKGTAG